MQKPIIAFIGAGRMATALASGIVRAGETLAEHIVGSDASGSALDGFIEAIPGARPAASNTDAVNEAAIVVLAVKPQYMGEVLDEVQASIDDSKLVISIAAGVTIESIAQRLGEGVRIARVMPNTPCLIGLGASGFSMGPNAASTDAPVVARLMSAVGVVHEVPEPLLDAVTGVSGSGPAFVYTVIEAMADAGVRAGLPRAVANELAAATVAGAAGMVQQTDKHTAQLRDEVTSPGGTTAAGLAALERHGLRNALNEAVTATVARSKELAQT